MEKHIRKLKKANDPMADVFERALAKYADQQTGPQTGPQTGDASDEHRP